MINKKVVFCIPVRNESSNLKSLFKTLDKLNLKFEDYFIIFVESDSSDNSSDLIKKYLERRKGVLINKNLQGIENRVMRLAISRNEYLNFIKNDQSLKTYDLMIVLDCGGVNGSLTAKKIKNAILENENSIGIFPTQKFLYYDIWTLRIDNIINYDCFEELFKSYKKNSKIRKIFFNLIGKFLFINFIIKTKKINVISAYGGMGIYKLNKVIDFTYDSNNGKNCEHVEFNKQIYKKYGNCLVLDKNLTNSFGINIHTINILLCSASNYFANRFIKKII
tara:strand:- start:2781 stop:3614 length:834 start_codon:yes stop_codon:yes gene_type:complete